MCPSPRRSRRASSRGARRLVRGRVQRAPSTAERREGSAEARTGAGTREGLGEPSWRRRARAATRATRTGWRCGASRSREEGGGRRSATDIARPTASGAERIVRRVRYGRASREALARARRLGPIAGDPRGGAKLLFAERPRLHLRTTVRARLAAIERGGRPRARGTRLCAPRPKQSRAGRRGPSLSCVCVCAGRRCRGEWRMEAADGSSALLSSGCHVNTKADERDYLYVRDSWPLF